MNRTLDSDQKICMKYVTMTAASYKDVISLVSTMHVQSAYLQIICGKIVILNN